MNTTGTIVKVPTCRRCHKAPCQFYGATGGFSVACGSCNEDSRRKSRARYMAKRNPPAPKPSVNPLVQNGYPALWTDYMTVHELRAALANPDLMDGDLTNVCRVRVGGGGIFRLEIN